MMKRKRIISINRLTPFILLFFLVLTFYRLPQTFFQQDEWMGFGKMAIFEQDVWDGLKMFLPKTFFEHLTIGSFLTEYIQFKLFRMNFPPFAFVSLFLHFLNSLLVYYLVLIISKKRSLALIASLIFITNSISHQATTWISTSTSTQGVTLFVLISLILFFQYLKSNQDRAKFLFLSLISFFLSLLFKESSIFLFLFLPVFWYIFAPEKNFSQFRKFILPLFVVLLVYMMMRGLFLFNNFNVESLGHREETKKVMQTSVKNYAYRLTSFPFKALPQSFFTDQFLLKLSRNFTLIAYPHFFVSADGEPNPYVVESVAFDYLGFVLSIFILLFAVFMFKLLQRSKDEIGIKLLKISLSLVIVSYVPFVFIPGSGGFISIAEPRNLHIPNIGSSIFLALTIIIFSSWICKKIKFSLHFIVAFFLLLLISIHIRAIWKDLKVLEERSQVRTGILKKITSSHSMLPEKIIFYTESDTAYYGLPDDEKILPFQSGFGRTLLVWYYGNRQNVPVCFFKNNWLYEQNQDEGYKYCQRRGFGYFRKFESLKKALLENNLSSENVVAFSWNSKNKKFFENTKELRERLEEPLVR